MTLEDVKMEMLEQAGGNVVIADSIQKCASVLPQYERISVSVSGGKDSDIVLDLVSRLDVDRKCKYVWFNTGIEYQATKDHLERLEDKYKIQIIRRKPVKSIPVSCKEHGVPVFSKFVSEQIERLQRNGFQFEDEPFEVLAERYPGCKSGLRWWCNEFWREHGGTKSTRFDIARNRYLKEYMVQNPPDFPVSSKCCEYAKKQVAHRWDRENRTQLSIVGIRKAEGGIRAVAYSNCYTHNENGLSYYRPVFWYNTPDEEEYDQIFGVVHSDCYTRYGLQRTGCVGCPFGRTFDTELPMIEAYEPHLVRAANNIFGRAYDYMKGYLEFAKEMRRIDNEKKRLGGGVQMRMW